MCFRVLFAFTSPSQRASHQWTIEGAASRHAEDTTPTAGADKSAPGPRQAPSDSVKGGTSSEWRSPTGAG